MKSEELDSASPTPLDANSKRHFGVHRAFKAILIVFGCFNVVVGVVGIIVPGLPTTIFLIIALWSFSQSSERFHRWLYNHRLFGLTLQNWTAHGVIPRKAKALAVTVMSISWCVITYSFEGWLWSGVAGTLMVIVVGYILSRPSFRVNTSL